MLRRHGALRGREHMTGSEQSRWRSVVWLALVCLIGGILGSPGLMQQARAQQATSGEPPVTYTPPPRGAPGGSTGGGTRGPADTAPRLTVLALKEHAGLTVHAQPVLYWYLGQAEQHPVYVTL